MYLRIGNNRVIRDRDIVGIFDADTATVSRVTKQFLSAAERKKLVGAAGEEIPKSFLLYREDGLYKVCFSRFSPTVLKNRVGEIIR